ncbi:MAG: polymer-forming cytoskeletal protein [Thermodesulfobacteriota bacterium]|nr:polymer-forming cytoskeletal protein [Thermodesulfobacteriota bacterium]
MESERITGSISLITRNMKIEGEVNGKESLTIEGDLKGSININGDLHIESTGVVEADIEANNISIQGKVTGNVTARQHLEIESSGIMNGDISARSIDIKEGSSFEGRSNMIKSS